jgi:hypothetical protein
LIFLLVDLPCPGDRSRRTEQDQCGRR